MVSQRDLRTGDVDCGETEVAVGSLASAKQDCFSLFGIWGHAICTEPNMQGVNTACEVIEIGHVVGWG